MSENMLIFIPIEPTYLPGCAQTEQAKAFLQTLFPHAIEITVCITEEVAFIATGGNLEKIICPLCQSVLDEQWWTTAMDNAYMTSHFTNLTIILPCCGGTSSLNQLHYDLPTGFASFQLSARHPGHDIDDASLKELELILASPLRKIWVHF